MSVTVEVPRTTLVGPLLQMFFTDHLWNHKRVSPCTVKSYRDTFRLLLQYAEKTTAKQPSALSTTDLDAPMILAFLESLEQERHNLPASRNIRLTAIRSFFRFVALRDPASVGVATRVLAIPSKRTDKGLMGFLTRPEIDAIIANHDLSKWSGRRDHVLLLTLYNTGARVSEITSLRRNNFSLGVKSYVQFLGKGRKERSVPLWSSTARAVRAWFSELNPGDEGSAFPNARNGPLTRDGVNYVLQRAIERASPNCPSLSKKSISPHTIRHSCALHLLQSGVDIAVIALWLGHENIQTTHCYIEADLAMKEKALQKVAPAGQSLKRFKAKDALLKFLESL